MTRLRNHLFNVEGNQEMTEDQSDIDKDDGLHLHFENLVTDQDEVPIHQITDRDNYAVHCDQYEPPTDTVTNSDSGMSSVTMMSGL